MSSSKSYSSGQLTVLVILRLFIGWHFLYEGFAKLLNPYWTSAGYLNDSQGIFASIFKSIAANPGILQFVDIVNVWLLILIGFCLVTGLFSRTTSMAGAILLFLYYICQPPIIGYTFTLPSEGNYRLINKTLIEMMAFLVLFYFPTSRKIGLDYFIARIKR